MNKTNYWLIGLSAAGTVFAGYLSLYKLFTQTCALNESCPIFLGVPACWYGFAMFGIMLIASIWANIVSSCLKKSIVTTAVVSCIGIIFAGSFVVQEIATWIKIGHILPYTLGLPSCTYGLIFYIAIFIISLVALKKFATK